MLRANEGRITKTVANKSRIKISLKLESDSSAPDAVKTIKIPMMPKMTDAQIKTLVAIFCIG